ncbi:HTH-type transcriptional activator RhaS [compost metagenome]
MQKAYKMLQESDASIADIALDTGFKTPQHFSTAFKKKYGITPGKVRTEPVAK